MTQNWSFEIQKQLATDLILSVGYWVSRATTLHTNIAQVNALNPKFLRFGNCFGG